MKIVDKNDLIIRQSFAMFYGGSQIWFEQLDALFSHKDILINKFLNDMEYIKKPSSPALIAVNLDETIFDREMSDIIVNNFYNQRKFIKKVVFVGLKRDGQKLVRQSVNNIIKPLEFAITFNNDYEKAKEWLVN